uniref:Uncharacterized protein n=1 Tax=Solanum lycopersicum TaxID=4081 RepID=A0A3Q7H8Y8_SOLLC
MLTLEEADVAKKATHNSSSPLKVYTAAPTPSNIEAAMHTLGITSPDANWYMYTVATFHMTSAQVRKFTTDNSVSVEFDPFGFSVKDFQTWRPVMRCESRGELYRITNPVPSPSIFFALAPSLWHDHLGHLRALGLNFLRKNRLIECNQI